MPYTILIERTSSDSFSSERRQDELPIVWNDLSRAKDALRRIRELYRIDQQIDSERYTRSDNRALEERLWKASGLPESEKNEAHARYSMILLLDDGTEQKIGTFWRGWGEHLECATIIETVDPEMRFCPSEMPYDWWKGDDDV